MKINRASFCSILLALVTVTTLGKVSIRSEDLKAQNPPIKLGAYYFDGWTGETFHITESLKKDFVEREPIWGWVTSTPSIMRLQINAAAKAGISFFSFCWYITQGDLDVIKHPLNRALGNFLKAKNRNSLEFNLLVANHLGFAVGPGNWELATSVWIKYFKEPNYLRVNDKPLITFFEYRTLLREFGSAQKVRAALEEFRLKAIKNGLEGIAIAVCLEHQKDTEIAKKCGFDILTSYNNHNAGFRPKSKVTPIDSLTSAMERVWNEYSNSNMPYIPVVTLNWDARPWASLNKKNENSPRYIGFSEKSVFNQIVAVKRWVRDNPDVTTSERVAIVYAWNEYGEGAWLTPVRRKKKGRDYLKGLKRALIN